MNKLLLLLPALLLLPVAAFAQQFGEIDGFFLKIINFMNNTLVPLVFAIAFLVFLWGVFKTFILGGGDEEKQKEGKQLMMYSIVGFVLMVSLWGIVNFLAKGLGFDKENIEKIPNLPTGQR